MSTGMLRRHYEQSGGGSLEPPTAAEANLDDMNKAELLAEADRRGVDANESMTKAEIRAAIEEA